MGYTTCPLSLGERGLSSPPKLGQELFALAEELFDLPRSLTGEGVRKTLHRLKDIAPLEIVEVPSGTPVLDWQVPPEWRLIEGWIEDRSGKRWLDTRNSFLHVLGYSEATDCWLPLSELKQHLHTIPDYPDRIPYLTLYYTQDWGFALPHALLESMPEGEYRAVIRSEKFMGSLSYGECVLPGTSDKEILLSTYICHPSLANDNLSGIVVAAALASALSKMSHRFYTYRILFLPETIGALTWLATHRDHLDRISGGYVITCVGDRGSPTYKRSREGKAKIDRAMERALIDRNLTHRIVDFYPLGSDERQFSSPGFALPIGSLMRTPYGEYSEYHTSADDLSFITPETLEESLLLYLDALHILENNRCYRNLRPYGEPQLGKHGLYSSLGGRRDPKRMEAMLWTLNFSDGHSDLLSIAERSGLPFQSLCQAAIQLEGKGLLECL